MDKEQLEADQELAQSLVGRTITRARWFDESPDEDWTGHEVAWLWLDDGRVIEFGAYGYDAWGATMSEIRIVDVPQCIHCGQEHLDASVHVGGWGGPKLNNLPSDRSFAWCSDRNHAAMLLEEAAPVA